MSDLRWRAGEVLRLGGKEYLAANPPLLVITTTVPRGILQCLFFTLLGRVTGGAAGAEFSYVGSVAVIISLSTLVGVSDVPMLDKWESTFPRIQLSVLAPSLVFLGRALPRALEGLAVATVALVTVGAVTNEVTVMTHLLLALPLYGVVALTSLLAGLAAAAPAVGRRADVLVGNTFAYIVIAGAGVIVPVDRLGPLHGIGAVLPIGHGVEAVRAMLAGRSWIGPLLTECAVGAGWGLAAALAYAYVAAKSRRTGTDDFA